jgi:hypothetical protein
MCARVTPARPLGTCFDLTLPAVLSRCARTVDLRAPASLAALFSVEYVIVLAATSRLANCPPGIRTAATIPQVTT